MAFRFAVALAFTLSLGCQDTLVKRQCVNSSGTPINCPPEYGGPPVSTSGSATSGSATTGGTTGGVEDPPDTGDDDPHNINLCAQTAGTFTCAGRCGVYCDAAADTCQCDEACENFGECCDDFAELCSEVGNTDVGDDDGGTTSDDDPWKDYTFPAPFDVNKLSYLDCKGMATKNTSWCQTYDCRGIVSWDYNKCTTKDCKGIASANYSFCDSYDCRGIANGRKCELDKEECKKSGDSSKCDSEFSGCISNAKSFCKTWSCRAIVTGDSGYCSSGGFDNGNCKAVVKGSATYCFYGGEGPDS